MSAEHNPGPYCCCSPGLDQDLCGFRCLGLGSRPVTTIEAQSDLATPYTEQETTK